MTSTSPAPRHQTRRWATLVALTAALIAALTLGTLTGADAAVQKRTTKALTGPTSVVVDKVTCVKHADGSWDVTVTFEVTGGRYLNLGNPAGGTDWYGPKDNVYGGGARHIDSTIEFTGYPGWYYDRTRVITDTFTYQHLIAPVTPAKRGIELRSTRLVSRDFEVTYTCP